MRDDFGYSEEIKLGKRQDAKLLGRLYPYTRPYTRLLTVSVGLILLITLLDLALPYIIKVAIDNYIVPRMQTAAIQKGPARGPALRQFTIHLDMPEKKALIEKYRHLFTIEKNTALIPLDALVRIEKDDLLILRQNDMDGLARVALFFLGLVIINFGFNFVQKMIMEYTGHMIMHDLRMTLYTHIQGLSLDFFTGNPVARLVTRVTNDIQNMHELFTSVISMIFKDLFLLSGIAMVMLVLNWKLALASFTVLPVVVFAAFYFSKRARDIFRDLRVKVAQLNTHFSETIGGIRVVQMFRQELNNYQRFSTLNHENYLAGMRQIHVLAVFMPLIEFLGVIALALVIFYGGGRVLNHDLSLGALVAFISYLRMFFRPIRDLAEKYNILQNAMASAERIFLILDSESRLPQTPVTAKTGLPEIKPFTEIKFDAVSFGYVENETILKEVSFSIRAGETVAVVGPTGAGKTSLINLVLRFYDPTSGRVLINGCDLKDMDASVFRSETALVMQDPFLFSETIRDNIFARSPALSEEKMQKIIEAARCTHLIDRLPEGLDNLLSESGASLSSGERQLISIARAFARDPQLILFDEATSYIDTRTELYIQEALGRLMAHRTALVVAHRLSTIRNADRIIVLNRGRIIETGTHAELIRQKGFYYRLHQSGDEKLKAEVERRRSEG
ncbi:MAG: ABC transporter ATP-binding protein [Deltaproteobacteria bacterium]|nr:ABC transporter ATP-binding protein [Deltaproteobacteria bacterium]